MVQVYTRNTQWQNHPSRYVDAMKTLCAKHGMKPVCDYYGYCNNDTNAVYLGQNNGYFISNRGSYRHSFAYFPKGWKAIANKFGGNPLKSVRSNGPKMNYYDHCFYNGNSASAGRGLCGTATTSHNWYYPYQYAGFMCGSVNYKLGAARHPGRPFALSCTCAVHDWPMPAYVRAFLRACRALIM